MTTKLTPISALAVAGILKNQALATPANLSVANTEFTTTQISGASQTRLVTANTEVVTALTANVPAFLTGIVPVSWRANIPMGVSFNVNNLVDTVTTTADVILGNDAARFTEIITVAMEFAKSSYDLSGSVLGIQRQTDVGLNYSNIAGQITGGVTEQFGQSTIAGTAWQTFTSNLSNLGQLFNARDLPDCFRAQNLVTNLRTRGQTQAIDLAFTAANIANSAALTDRQVITVLDQRVASTDIEDIIDACGARLLSNTANVKFSDLLNLNNYIDASAQGIVDTGANLAAKLYNIAGVKSINSSFAEWGRLLSQINIQGNIQLITTVYNNPAEFANSVSIDAGYFGTGNTVFGTPTLLDIIGPAADLVTESVRYSDLIQEIRSLQANITANTLGQTLLTAITSGTSTDIAQAGAAVVSGMAATVARGQSMFQQIYDQIVQVKSNLIASEITDGQGSINTDITGTPMTVRSFVTGSNEYYKTDQIMALGFGSMIKSMATDTVYGQSILASQSESKNLELLRGASVVDDAVAAVDAKTYGPALTQQTANLALAANLSTEANLTYTITNIGSTLYGEVFDLPVVHAASYSPSTEIYLPDNRLQFSHLDTADFVTVEFDIADTLARNFWFNVTGDLTANNFANATVQTTAVYTSKKFKLSLATSTNVPPTLDRILTFRIELYLTADTKSRPIWTSADIKIVPYGFQISAETGL